LRAVDRRAEESRGFARDGIAARGIGEIGMKREPERRARAGRAAAGGDAGFVDVPLGGLTADELERARRVMKVPRRAPPALSLSVQFASNASDLPTRAQVRRWVKAALDIDAVVTVRFVDAIEGRELAALRDVPRKWVDRRHATLISDKCVCPAKRFFRP
jgi:hypothetical protein